MIVTQALVILLVMCTVSFASTCLYLEAEEQQVCTRHRLLTVLPVRTASIYILRIVCS